MKEEKKQKDLQSLKTGGAALAGAAVGGVAGAFLTPVMAFPSSSDEEIEVDESAMDAEALVIDEVEAEDQENASAEHVEHVAVHHPDPDYEPEMMEVAGSVDDSMSFNEAFAAAREEVGPGGLFVWHGNTYGTYYANEWNGMSELDQQHYWADVHHTTTNLNDLANTELDPWELDESELEDDDVAEEYFQEDHQDDVADMESQDEQYYDEEEYPEEEIAEEECWDESTDENPDIDLLASNDIDSDVPFDNNMDMSDFA